MSERLNKGHHDEAHSQPHPDRTSVYDVISEMQRYDTLHRHEEEGTNVFGEGITPECAATDLSPHLKGVHDLGRHDGFGVMEDTMEGGIYTDFAAKENWIA